MGHVIDLPKIIRTYEAELKKSITSSFPATLATLAEFAQSHVELSADRYPKYVSMTHWYTRLASALTNWLTAPATEITLAELRRLVAYKNELVYIFGASGYRGTNHLATLINNGTDDSKVILDRQKLNTLAGCPW